MVLINSEEDLECICLMLVVYLNLQKRFMLLLIGILLFFLLKITFNSIR